MVDREGEGWDLARGRIELPIEGMRRRERQRGRGTSIPTPQMITLRPSTNWPATLRVSVDQQGDTGRGVDVRGRS